jgi:hypothetical protein
MAVALFSFGLVITVKTVKALEIIKKIERLTDIEEGIVVEEIKTSRSDPKYLISRKSSNKLYEIRPLSIFMPKINIGDKIRIKYDSDSDEILPVELTTAIYAHNIVILIIWGFNIIVSLIMFFYAIYILKHLND